MKTLIFFSLALLLLLFSENSSQVTFLKAVIDNGADERFLLGEKERKFQQQIEDTIKANKEFANLSQKFEIKINKEKKKCDGPKNQICIFSENASTTVIFKNELEENTLELNNFKLEDEEVTFEAYIKEFIKSFANILTETDKLDKLTKILTEFSANKKLKLEKTQRTTNSWSANINFDKEDKQGLGVNYQENTLNFDSSYFSKSMTLASVKSDAFENEVKTLAEEADRLAERMHSFSLGNLSPPASLECESLLTQIDTKAIFNRIVLENIFDKSESSNFELKVEKDGLEILCYKKSFKIKCEKYPKGSETDEKETDEIELIVFNITPVVPLEPFSQVFFDESLYNIVPVVSAFIEDVVALASKTCFAD